MRRVASIVDARRACKITKRALVSKILHLAFRKRKVFKSKQVRVSKSKALISSVCSLLLMVKIQEVTVALPF